MRAPVCPHCNGPLGEHRAASRCLDYWFAELVLGWVWVKHAPHIDSMHPGQRFLTSPDYDERANAGMPLPVFIPADGTEPIHKGPLTNDPDDSVPNYSAEEGNTISNVRHMGALGFNGAFVYYEAESRWKCAFTHKEHWVGGAMTDASLPYAVTFAAIEAVDLLRRREAQGAA